MESRISLTTKIIETIKDKEDELIINFIADNTNLCEEHKIPKDKIKEVFEFYDTYRNKNLNITCGEYLNILGLNKNLIYDTQYGLNYPITRDFIEYVKILQKENKIKKDRMARKPLAVNVKSEETEGGVVLTGELTSEGEKVLEKFKQRQREVILSIPDELEPEAKWEKTNCSTEYFGKLSRCSKCGYETFPQDDTNYCGGCGERIGPYKREE